MKKVMLVEDEEFILQGIRCIIDWEEISMTVVSLAHNGREALEMFSREPADIVVTENKHGYEPFQAMYRRET